MKNLTLNPKLNTSKPLTACSLIKPISKSEGEVKVNITAGMSPKEISAVVSDHIIKKVKEQFEKKELK